MNFINALVLLTFVFSWNALCASTSETNTADELSVHPQYQELHVKIIETAKENPAIRGVAVIGSQARKNHPADPLSDLDLWIITDHPDELSTNKKWIKEIADPLAAYHCTTTYGNHVEWRVLFSNGLDVDFSIIPVESIKFSLSDHNHDLVQRGIRFVVDKENYREILSELERVYGTVPYKPKLPEQSVFEGRVNAFWYLALWTSRKLKRGEPLAADLNGLQKMRAHLLMMLEWETHLKKGYFEPIWQNGRFLGEWLDKSDYDQFKKTYAGLEITEMKKALNEMMALFRKTSNAVAEKLNFPSHEPVVKSVMLYIID